MTASDVQMLAQATDLVLDRLEAWRAGNQQEVAEIDARFPHDARWLTAMWSAAFGIAGRTLNVLAELDPAEARKTVQSFREQVEEYRRE